MSLHPVSVGLVSGESARVVPVAIPKYNVYMQLRDVLGASSTTRASLRRSRNAGRSG